MQPMEKKNKRPVDWLSIGFLVMAVVSMAVSVPATFSVASLTHASLFGAALVVFIAEVMAFGAKLATRWFPTWHKQLNSFAVVMLSAAVLPNAVEGWNALWRPEAAEGVWAAIRGTSIYGFPVFAVLIVGVWAALPPVGVYLSLTFWVRRQHELETEQTPEAVVNRRLQPIIIEMQVQQRLDEALLGLIEQRQKQFAALTGPVFQAPRLAGPSPVVPSKTFQPVRMPSEPIVPAPAQQDAATDEAQLPEAPADETSEPFTEASEPVVRPYGTVGARLDEVLAQVGMNREAAKTRLERFGIKTPEAAFTALQRLGALPPAVSFEEFVPLFGVLMEQACDTCGKAMSQGERGVAVKYARRHNQPVCCTECRRASKES